MDKVKIALKQTAYALLVIFVWVTLGLALFYFFDRVVGGIAPLVVSMLYLIPSTIFGACLTDLYAKKEKTNAD